MPPTGGWRSHLKSAGDDVSEKSVLGYVPLCERCVQRPPDTVIKRVMISVFRAGH